MVSYWKQVTNKKLVKAGQSISQKINKTQGKCYYCLTFAELRTPQDPQLKPMSQNFFWM